jgi:ribonuclease HI
MSEKCDIWVNAVKHYITVKVERGGEIIQKLSFACREHSLAIRVEEYIQRGDFALLIAHLLEAGATYYRGGLFLIDEDALNRLAEKHGEQAESAQPPITVYFDGLCEPRNPGGIAAYGFLVYQGESKVYEKWGVIGEGAAMSNNVAEYYAVCEALSWLLNNGYHNTKITVRGDSQLVVNQLGGWWGVRGGLYYQYYVKAKKYLDLFADVKFEWVPRERNKEADELTRRAYEDYCHTMGRPVEYMREKWGVTAL